MDRIIDEMNVGRLVAIGMIASGSQHELARVLAILGLDFAKNVWINARVGTPPPGVLANNEHYHQWDKPLDWIGYFVSQLLLQRGNILPTSEIGILENVLYFRAIGVVIAALTGSRAWLMLFVDLYKEFLALFLLGTPQWTFVVAIVFKLWVEYKFHVTKEGRAGLTKISR
jgi:hypothetical protein